MNREPFFRIKHMETILCNFCVTKMPINQANGISANELYQLQDIGITTCAFKDPIGGYHI